MTSSSSHRNNSTGLDPTTARAARASLLAEMAVEELPDLIEVLLGLRRGRISRVLRMRLALKDVERGFDARSAHFPVHANRITQEQIARAGREDRRRETAIIAIHRRQHWILQIVS